MKKKQRIETPTLWENICHEKKKKNYKHILTLHMRSSVETYEIFLQNKPKHWIHSSKRSLILVGHCLLSFITFSLICWYRNHPRLYCCKGARR